MKWFLNLKIAAKLIVSFVFMAIISGVVGTIGIVYINRINANDDILYNNMTVPISEIAQLSSLYQRARVNTRDLIILDNPEDIKGVYDRLYGFLDEMDVITDSFEKTIITDEVSVAYNKYRNALAANKEDLEELMVLCLANKDAEAYQFSRYGDFQNTADELRIAIDELTNLKVANAAVQAKANLDMAKKAVYTMVLVIAGAMILAIALGIFLSRIISKPMRYMANAANRIADGDLDVYVDINTKEEVGQLAHAFNVMAERLNDLMFNINIAAEQVASGSAQVSQSSIGLSQGATEQASTVEELTASLEEIASQTKANADTSSQASSLAEETKAVAVRGNQQMDEMLKAMDEINTSSNSISKIIKVIDDIAFQTNMLALNAAVEAARAGQHGKGFAVVAEEVRNLAARSASAAKETTEMIEGSIKNVREGTALAKQTSAALNEIVERIAKVANLMGDIAVASNEQANGINQVNQGVVMVSTVIQNNSATSEESAAAAEELSRQAELLKEEVAKFKLKKSANSAQSIYRNESAKHEGKLNLEMKQSASVPFESSKY